MKLAMAIVLASIFQQATAAEIDPSGRTVYQRYVDALGGTDLIQGVQSLEVHGRYQVEGGPAGDMTLMLARPDKLLFKIELDGVGTIIQATDGKVAWRQHPVQGLQILTAQETRMIDKWVARGFSLLPDIAAFSHVGTPEDSHHAGRPCRKIALTLVATGEQYQDCFDVETGLLIGRWESSATPNGPATMMGWSDEYRQFGPLTVATHWSHELDARRWSANYQSVEVNALDPAVFAVPAELRAAVQDTQANATK